MIQALATLLAVALLSFISKDRLLMTAALILALLAVLDSRPTFALLHKHAFTIGIFFLMLFILLPIATQKISVIEMSNRLLSFKGALAVVAGLAASCVGGKGVTTLAHQPSILAGVLLGTLIAVLFFDGLPAGLIIAAGFIGLIEQIFG